ncbi:MAG: efflux RND transporter permease subunit, partial [Spirochaetales bacterium]|nr:efflux RND transporter permease subunit [Candidatus Physcosoma equi]
TGYTLPKMNMAFIPSTDNSDFYINIEFPYGYSLEDTTKGMEKIEELVLDYLPPSSIKTYATFSGTSSGSGMSFRNTPYQGGMHIVLVPVKERDYDIHDAIREIQYLISEAVPDAQVEVANGGFDRLVGFIAAGGGFGVKLVGDDNEVLYETASRIADYLMTDPEVMSCTINASYDNASAVMNTNYEALSSLGISSYEAGMTNAILFNGMTVGKYTDPDTEKRYDIHVSSDIMDYPIDESILSLIRISGAAGDVSMATLADLKVKNELSQINHSERAKSMSVSAKITSESTTAIQARLGEWLKENPLPEGVSRDQSGLGALVADAVPPMVRAMLIAIFLVYFVMVMVFERYNQPLQVMMTVPFCLIGVTLSLTVFGTSLNMVSILGVVSLAGMLVNNGIILIDSINQLNREKRSALLQERGVDITSLTEEEMMGRLEKEMELQMLFENTASGSTSRLRPILMSSLTTILGV